MKKILETSVERALGDAEAQKKPKKRGKKNIVYKRMTDEDTKAFIAKREKETSGMVHQPKAIKKVIKTEDQEYLLRHFEILKNQFDRASLSEERISHPGVSVDSDMRQTFRFPPAMMYDNAVKYIESTIEANQPLTISGMSLFMGINRKMMFLMMHRTEMKSTPQFSFIYAFCNFIEMYNEYVAHKKQNPAAPIFILKNFGWSDKFEIEASAKTEGALSEQERNEAQKRLSMFSEENKK